MPSSPKAKACIVKLIQEHLPYEFKGNILELGSGFLTLGLPLAKQFPKSEVIAYETSTIPYLVSIAIKFFYPGTNLTILNQDFFTSDFSPSSLVICYLYPAAMKKLSTKFSQELNPGSYIISNTFAIPGLTPYKTVTINDLYLTKIYLYKI